MLNPPDTAPAATHAVLAQIDAWATMGWLRTIDAALARWLATETPDAPPRLLVAAALTSHQLGRGHTCLDLAALATAPADTLALPAPNPTNAGALAAAEAALQGVSLDDWLAALEHPTLVGNGPGAQPLVRVQHRLYLRRYWGYEQAVRTALQHRMHAPATDDPGLRRWLDVLFPPPTPAAEGPSGLGSPDWQKVACAVAASRPFCLITGGPGTGKTTTVVRLLALLQAQALETQGGRPLRIRLAAPTGKAAARLSGSIASAIDRLPLAHLPQPDALRAALPADVQTLHRLLGSRPDSRRFRHHAGHPLPLDVLVVDEASMIDLEMMHAVLDALPPQARLVLLGDKDQLASVEAGAVLGQLCRDAEAGRYLNTTARWVETHTGEQVPPAMLAHDAPPLAQHVVMLRHSRRFDARSGIGQLAQAVNVGDVGASLALLAAPTPDLQVLRPAPGSTGAWSAPAGPDGDVLATGYHGYLALLRDTLHPLDADDTTLNAWAQAVLQAQTRFQVLCALREGPWGVTGLNQRIERTLQATGLLAVGDHWYLGRPVLVTRNDPALGLMNGDMGVVLQRPRPDRTGWLRRVAFPAPDGGPGVRWVLPSRLTSVETVFALTVHKSQGSEFDHVALVLPEHPSPVLTRELVYTGITRARQRFTLLEPGSPQVWASALQRRTQRAGALADGL